jgi:hypothetical protein
MLRGVSAAVRGAGVRFLITSRPVASITAAFPKEARWDLDDAGDADIETYVRGRLTGRGPVDDALVAGIAGPSAGNFLYAELLVDFVEAHPSEAAALVAELNAAVSPTKVWSALDDVYRRFLRREFGPPGGSDDWTKGARPVLATLAVAREKLAMERLRWLLDPDPDPLAPGVVERALPRCLQYLDGDPPAGPFGLYHFSFREFLFRARRRLRRSGVALASLRGQPIPDGSRRGRGGLS